jgi:PKD repeat protein
MGRAGGDITAVVVALPPCRKPGGKCNTLITHGAAWKFVGRRTCVWIACLLVLPGVAGQAHELAKTSHVSAGSEPVILADREGRSLWIGDTSGGYYSEDNGTKWQPMGSYVGGANLYARDGWALAQDETGNLYAAVLRDNRVDVTRSADGGKTWNQVGYLAGVSGTADRPWIAAKGTGEVAMFYFDAPAVLVGFSEHCARSLDGGLTFADRDPVSVIPGQGGSAFYDSEGKLYFSSNTGRLYRYNGLCIQRGTAIPMIPGASVNNMLQGAADGTDLYMVAATDGSKAITLAGSQDAGPVRTLVVSPPELASNTYAAIAARDGRIAVAWYGSTTPGDPSSTSFNGEFRTYLAVVEDFWGKPTVTQHVVSPTPNHKGSICMSGFLCDDATRGLLDYFGVTIDIWGGIHVAYVDDTAGAKVFHAHFAPHPPPPPGAPPRASFTVRIEDKTLEADALRSTSPLGLPLAYEWDWGDGAKATGRKATHTYAEYGSYDVRLTVRDSEGRKASHTVRVALDGKTQGPPLVSWSHSPERPLVGETVTFRDESKAQGGGALLAEWSFGDGTSRRGGNVDHVYLAPGNFTVTLTVVDALGAKDSLTKDIEVLASRPTETTTTKSALGIGAPLAGLALLALALLRRGTARPSS